MNSAKNTAKIIAKQIAQEPLEILKNARKQVIPEENYQEEGQEQTKSDDQAKKLQEQQKLQDKMKSIRRTEAFARELEDIKKENLFKDLQRKIANGEVVYLEEYPTLSPEQKQVLNAQAEAVHSTKYKVQSTELQEPAAKKGRQLFNFGKKTGVQREQTRVEKPIPPSG